MRGLIILCLTSLVFAAPQSGGYNYGAVSNQQQQQQHQPHQQYGGAISASTATFLKDLQAVMAVQSANIESPNFVAAQQPQSVITYPTGNEIETQYTPTGSSETITLNAALAQPAARYLAPSVLTAAGNSLPSTSVFGSATDALQFVHHQQQQQQAAIHDTAAESIVTKRFFIHSAPEEEAEEIKYKSLTVGKPRKNYNVVFIKAPAKPAQKTSLKIIPAVNEEKTVIYVLAKKHDDHEIDAHVHEPVTTTAKPEVYFIKYKTPEEAAHAQQTIQAQYDSLDGSTHISNEGISPVSSVIGTLDAIKHANAAADAAQAEQEAQYVAAVSSGSTQQQLQAQQQETTLLTQQSHINNQQSQTSKYFH